MGTVSRVHLFEGIYAGLVRRHAIGPGQFWQSLRKTRRRKKSLTNQAHGQMSVSQCTCRNHGKVKRSVDKFIHVRGGEQEHAIVP